MRGETIRGDETMPNPNGGEMVGREGHGFARITAIEYLPAWITLMGGLRVQLTNYPCPNDQTTSTANDGIPDSQKLIFPPINVNMRDFLVHYYGGASIPNVFVKMYNYNVNPVFPYTSGDYNMPHETEWLMHYDDENDYEFYFTAVPVETFGSHRNIHIGIIRDMRENFGVFGELYVFADDDWLHMGNVSFSPAQIEAFGEMAASQGRESIVVRMYNGSGLTITEYLTLNRSELNDRHTRLWLLSRGIPTLAFYGNEGTPYLQMTEIINGVPTPPFDEIEEPTRHGFAFDGWYNTPSATDGTRFEPPNPLTPITRSVNFWARWTPIVEITSPADDTMMELEDIISANGLLVEWETAPNSSAEYRLFLRNVTTNTFPIEILTVGTASTGAGEFFIPQSRANFTEGNRYRVYVTKVVGNRIIAQSTAEFQIACNFFRFYGGLGWRWPLPNPLSVHISSGYLLPTRPGHGGIDIVWSGSPGAIRGEPVYAPHDGLVTHSQNFTGGGNTVAIRSDVIDPTTGLRISSRSMHMCWGEDNKYQPVAGQRITMGTQIGLVSDTGSEGSVHLHLDFNRANIVYGNVAGFVENTVNPQRFFPHIRFTGATSSRLDGR